MLNTKAKLPRDVENSLSARSTVLGQAIKVEGARWTRVLADRNLPPAEGKLDTSERTVLSRQDVFEYGDREINTENAFQLLYYSMAWGLGLKARQLEQRMNGVAANEDAGKILVDAWNSVRCCGSVEDAYRNLIKNRGAGKIRNFGPAFVTKFLYFAQGSNSAIHHVILDGVVASNLAQDVWPSAPTAAWWPDTYQRYCDLLSRWTREVTQEEARSVEPDEIEYALFNRQHPPN